MTEVDAVLGYIVGRKAALPDGSAVRIDLTGPVESTYVVVVDGRAAGGRPPRRRADGHPGDAGHEASFGSTGGRIEPGSHLGGDLEIAGDQSMGLHLASNMAMTI